MSRARKVDVSVQTGSILRLVGCGVESTRLNFDMNGTNVPSYEPYEDFQCHAADAVDDLMNELNNVDDVVPNTDPYNELNVPRADSDSTGIQNVSLSAFDGFMEQLKSRDHYTIKILRHEVEHCSINNLLKIWEDSQCPDYLLQSILEWSYNAKVDG